MMQVKFWEDHERDHGLNSAEERFADRTFVDPSFDWDRVSPWSDKED